jgi:hypothetical protein
VGAPGKATAAGAFVGAAYVFTRTGNSWTQQQQLHADDGAVDDLFGYSVSVAGDTALVGAPGKATAAGAFVGAAYVFTRTGTTWTQQQRLLADDGVALDSFGSAVSVAGDSALVGAWGNDTAGGTDAGSAYLFTRTGTTWTQRAQLLADDGFPNDVFGSSVSLFGDTALVGAPNDDTIGGTDSGSAYVFVISQPSDFYTLTPCRVFDSRQTADGPALASGLVRLIAVHGRCGVPASARMISFNVTAVGASAGGHLTVYPADLSLPSTSTLNFAGGQTRANNGVVSLATDGTGTLAIRPAVVGGGAVHVIVDVNGFFE